jgi:predicted nuclease of predicted toxin-antitoxin system
MKFIIDENLPSELAPILGDLGFNAETIHSEDLSGQPDEAIFEVCRKGNRAFITLDLHFSQRKTA